tara:strand:+ start:2892 stop:5087 length:2196 start_codon:yes stop_codon:yes gene_type:complete
MRIFLKLILFVFFILLFSVIYLSFFGLETKKFNNQISQRIKTLDENLEINLNQVKILLNPFQLKINAKTIGPKLLVDQKIIDLESIKTEISLESIIKDEFSIKNLQISTKSLELENLISFLRTFENSSQLYLLEKITKSGFIIADINLEFDSKGKIKSNFEINGFIKDGRIDLTKKIKFNKINSIFKYKNKNLEVLNLDLFFNKIKINSEKINIENSNKVLYVKGKINNQEIDLDKENIVYIQNIFPKNSVIEKIKFSSKNEFSFEIKNKFEVKNFKMSSIIKLKELLIENYYDLKNYFPDSENKISLINNEIKLNLENKKLYIEGAGNLLIQSQNDRIQYQIKKDDRELKFKTIFKTKDNPLKADFLNFQKKENSELVISINGLQKFKKETIINLISLKEQKNEILIKDLILKKNKISAVGEISLNFLDNENFRNLVVLSKKKKNNYLLKGSSFNAIYLIDRLLTTNDKNKTDLIDQNFRLKIQIDNVLIDKKSSIKNFSGKLSFNKSQVSDANFNGKILDDKKFKFTVVTTGNTKVTTLYIDNAEPIVNRYKFIKGFEKGILDFNSINEYGETKSILKIYNFKLKELPTLTKILTLASLQGIADILSGEGIRFTEFEMSFKTKKNLMTIDEIYAIGPAISILMDGYVQKDNLISLRGTLVPATTINKAIGSIPVLGKILVGSKTGEGVFGVSFKIKGPPKKLETTVNPIKTLTPRFITRTLEKIKKSDF